MNHPDDFKSTQPEIGGLVIYHDSKGKAHSALVTAVYSPSCINAAYISSDETEQDSYGRQMKRTASVVHKSVMAAHGNYWRWPSEDPNEYTDPVK